MACINGLYKRALAMGAMVLFVLMVLNMRWVSEKLIIATKSVIQDQDKPVQPQELANFTQKQNGPINVDGQFKMVTNNDLAMALQEQVRVLCWIAVTKDTKDRVSIIQQTWGRRCTKLLMIGDETTGDLPDTIKLDVPKGRKHLWPKTRQAFQYIYDNHFNDADWFLKADTDSYYIMENLRHFLAQQDLSKPAYFGCNIKLYIKEGYNSGGAGYILNKASLKLLVDQAYKDNRCNKGYMEDEDVSMGYCMSKVGVKPGDPTDENGKNRFFPFEPADHVSPASPGANGWYWKSTYKPGAKNMSCCSDTWISFHYVGSQLMWNMEFLLYHSKIIGVNTMWIPNDSQQKLN